MTFTSIEDGLEMALLWVAKIKGFGCLVLFLHSSVMYVGNVIASFSYLGFSSNVVMRNYGIPSKCSI